jgi:hypothetical protein
MPTDLQEETKPAITRREIVVVITIVAILAMVITVSGSSTGMRWQAEWKAWNWTPGPADRIRPDESLIAPGMAIAGTWRATIGRLLTITPQENGEYSVLLSTGGCLGHWKLERTAKFHDGVLTLNHPLVEYAPNIYDTIYAVRVGGRDYLLAASDIGFFQKELQSAVVDGSDADEPLFGFVFSRRAEFDP